MSNQFLQDIKQTLHKIVVFITIDVTVCDQTNIKKLIAYIE